MTVEKHVTVKKEIEITGATLLPIEEAVLIPLTERRYSRAWWLRSPGNDSYGTCCVWFDGFVFYNCNPDFPDYYVRPALILKNLEKTDFQIGDVFALCGYKFKVISNTLAWMFEGDIGFKPFRENWKATDANDYEKSDIKKYVDSWFEKIMDFAKPEKSQEKKEDHI